MENYRQISLKELCELIANEDYSNIYAQEQDKKLLKGTAFSWSFKELTTYKWFKLEESE